MKFISTAIPEVVIIEPTQFEDERGWFMEAFNEKKFHKTLKQHGLAIPPSFVQDNHSFSKKNVLRGMHYQLPPHAQGKLVRVTQGAAYDVVVDIRIDSPTFKQWVAVELNSKNNYSLWVPAGFAHGFLSLAENTHFLYKTTDYYSKECERSIRWNDPELAIVWPEANHLTLNSKDETAPFFNQAELMSYETRKKNNKMITLKSIGDDRGHLIALEACREIPFDLKRIYYIFNTKEGVSRGYHAHKNLKQLAVCVSGKCRMILDDGQIREEYWLDSPTKGLLIDSMIWREMHDFSEDCVLAVLASEFYSESDYIRDYNHFLKEINCV